ncbi:O-antigen polysaccharide polymerase Wzy family protein [Caldifermentibacillus hisashii]|uniref:O-antigen polysaccharide polymerase Wzy family protein n=1 Tax=Caldifermentibacillus hisashii TaxID=996558 RepID=UPI003422D29B
MNIVIRLLLSTGSILFFLIGILFQEPKILLVATLLIFAHNIVYSLKKFYERIVFFCFNVTFFIFLIGRMVVTEFFGYKIDYAGLFGLAFEEKEIIMVVISCLYLSLLAIFIGYTLIQRMNLSFLKPKKELSSSYLKSVRLFSLLFFYFCLVFRLIYDYQMRQAAMSEGYFESFSTFRSTLPFIFESFSNMYDVAFFGYLATNPTKRKSFFPILLYIGEGLFSALAGRRSILMLNILIVFIYYCIRSIPREEKQEKKWFGKFEWTMGVVVFPFIMEFLTLIGNLRVNFSGKTQKLSFVDSILEFFYSQGVSANLIGYTKIYENQIPKGRLFTFGPIMEFIDNKIIRPLKGLPEYFGQTAERAINGHLFSQTLTYIIMPLAYLKGYGYGSSFVAELYNDFSFTGVFIGSIVYGALLYIFFYMLRNSHYILIIFTLMMTRAVLFAPRGAYLSFIVSSFSMPKIVGVIIIVVGSYLFYSLSGQRKFVLKKTY